MDYTACYVSTQALMLCCLRSAYPAFQPQQEDDKSVLSSLISWIKRV